MRMMASQAFSALASGGAGFCVFIRSPLGCGRPARGRAPWWSGHAGDVAGQRVGLAPALDLGEHLGAHLVFGEPALIPEGGKGIARAAQPIAPNAAGVAALVGDDAAGPRAAQHPAFFERSE